jgi:hypothetical protein
MLGETASSADKEELRRSLDSTSRSSRTSKFLPVFSLGLGTVALRTERCRSLITAAGDDRD